VMDHAVDSSGMSGEPAGIDRVAVVCLRVLKYNVNIDRYAVDSSGMDRHPRRIDRRCRGHADQGAHDCPLCASASLRDTRAPLHAWTQELVDEPAIAVLARMGGGHLAGCSGAEVGGERKQSS